MEDDFDDLFDEFVSNKNKKDKQMKKIGQSRTDSLPLWSEVPSKYKFEKNYKCLICRRVFDNDDIVEACDKCERYFHYRHIREWIKIRAVCPNCKR